MLATSLLAAASLLTPALALPYATLQSRQAVTPSDSVSVPQVTSPQLNVTYSSPVNSSLPNVVIFATGGTIAGSSTSNTDSTSYQAGVIGVEALVQGELDASLARTVMALPNHREAAQPPLIVCSGQWELSN